MGKAISAKDREQRAREAVRRAKRNVVWLFSTEDNRKFFRKHLEGAGINLLVAAAWEGDKDAFEILRDYARGARQHSTLNVPDEFHALVWECFINGPPKQKPGTSPKDNDLTYQTIAVLVRYVNVEFGFPLHDAPVTAISIVAEELGYSESRILRIWEEFGGNTSKTPSAALPRN